MNGQPMPLDRWLNLKSHVYISNRKANVAARLAPPSPAPVPPVPSQPTPVAPTNSRSTAEQQRFFNGLAEQIYQKKRAARP